MSWATYRGVGIGNLCAIGEVARFDPPAGVGHHGGNGSDLERAVYAMDECANRLESLAATSSPPASEILLAQSLMARDPAFRDAVSAEVAGGSPAGVAIKSAADRFANQLQALGGYFAERARDVADVGALALRLLGSDTLGELPVRDSACVLVAKDLSPADTVGLDPAMILAIVTEGGGPTSHTSVIARALGIPAVVGCAGAAEIAEGDRVLVDPVAGEVLLQPEVSEWLLRSGRREARRAQGRVKGDLISTGRVELLVNVGALDELPVVAAAESGGVGLLRTEFIFLNRVDSPSVEEQAAVYGEVFAAFSGRKVVARTLDSGADKPLAFLRRGEEPNPALGIRGVRTRSSAPQVLDDQLSAFHQAARESGCRLWVMAPMVATTIEAREFVSLCRKHSLKSAGVMVEVPALALRAREVMAQVDFVSLGTNDLSQYAFAADRELGQLAALLDPWQPALLELAGMVGSAGRSAGKPVGVCGEAASDPALAVVLAGLGATSLSVSARALPPVREALSAVGIREARRAARAALVAGSAQEARQEVLELLGWASR